MLLYRERRGGKKWLSSMIMNIKFLFNGLEVDSDKRAYVEKKVLAVKKMLTTPERAEVDISQDKHGFYRVEVMLYEPHKSFRAEEVAQTIEAAIDLVEEKLKEQIRDDNEKQRVLSRRGARSIKKKTVIDDAARF